MVLPPHKAAFRIPEPGGEFFSAVPTKVNSKSPQDIEDDEAMSFFGGEEGDADESQG